MARSDKRTNLARSFRKRDIPCERLLWNALRGRALGGFKFGRQHPIGPYVVDLACVACKVIVELDGETHVGNEAADANRTVFLDSEGWCVVRFWNSAIHDDLESVKEAIYQLCVQRESRE